MAWVEGRIPARSPGTLGLFDQGDPNFGTLLGDTPGALGLNDHGAPDFFGWPPFGFAGYMCRAADGAATTAGAASAGAAARLAPTALALGDKGLNLLGEVEELRLKPYDDQTGADITAWVAGATIGYGHLIAKGEWDTYKNGQTKEQALALFRSDLAPFVTSVQTNITATLLQQEFDALVMLVFNIGRSGFAGSSVVKLVNDPQAKTPYADLEAAWKSWNKSQGKVMKGLDNRRACEWKVYKEGVYEKW